MYAGCPYRLALYVMVASLWSSVLSLSLVFFECVCFTVNQGPFCIVLFCVICVFCLLVVLVRLSLPVQVIDWKDSSPK